MPEYRYSATVAGTTNASTPQHVECALRGFLDGWNIVELSVLEAAPRSAVAGDGAECEREAGPSLADVEMGADISQP